MAIVDRMDSKQLAEAWDEIRLTKGWAVLHGYLTDLRLQGYTELREASTVEDMWKAQGGLNVLEHLYEFPTLIDQLIADKKTEEGNADTGRDQSGSGSY